MTKLPGEIPVTFLMRWIILLLKFIYINMLDNMVHVEHEKKIDLPADYPSPCPGSSIGASSIWLIASAAPIGEARGDIAS